MQVASRSVVVEDLFSCPTLPCLTHNQHVDARQMPRSPIWTLSVVVYSVWTCQHNMRRRSHHHRWERNRHLSAEKNSMHSTNGWDTISFDFKSYFIIQYHLPHCLVSTIYWSIFCCISHPSPWKRLIRCYYLIVDLMHSSLVPYAIIEPVHV